eukprot:s2518_g12.t1
MVAADSPLQRQCANRPPVPAEEEESDCTRPAIGTSDVQLRDDMLFKRLEDWLSRMEAVIDNALSASRQVRPVTPRSFCSSGGEVSLDDAPITKVRRKTRMATRDSWDKDLEDKRAARQGDQSPSAANILPDLPEDKPKFASTRTKALEVQETLSLRQQVAGCMQTMLATNLDKEDEKLSFPRRVLARIVKCWLFEAFFALVILSNSVFIAVQVEATAKDPGIDQDVGYFVVGSIYTFLFTTELVLRVLVFGLTVFIGPDWAWLLLDLLVVSSSLFEFVLELALQQQEDSTSVLTNMRLLRILRIGRITRAIRVVRLVKFIRSLRQLLYSIGQTLRAMAWSVVLLGLIIFLFGLIFTDISSEYLTRDVVEISEEYEGFIVNRFGGLERSMHTLFASVTGGLTWIEALDALSHISTVWGLLFEAYIAFCLFAVLNVMTGVFCQSAMESAEKDHELVLQNVVQEKAKYFRAVRRLFAQLDQNGDGGITAKEFEVALEDPALMHVFDALEISADDAWNLFTQLDSVQFAEEQEEEWQEVRPRRQRKPRGERDGKPGNQEPPTRNVVLERPGHGRTAPPRAVAPATGGIGELQASGWQGKLLSFDDLAGYEGAGESLIAQAKNEAEAQIAAGMIKGAALKSSCLVLYPNKGEHRVPFWKGQEVTMRPVSWDTWAHGVTPVPSLKGSKAVRTLKTEATVVVRVVVVQEFVAKAAWQAVKQGFRSFVMGKLAVADACGAAEGQGEQPGAKSGIDGLFVEPVGRVSSGPSYAVNWEEQQDGESKTDYFKKVLAMRDKAGIVVIEGAGLQNVALSSRLLRRGACSWFFRAKGTEECVHVPAQRGMEVDGDGKEQPGGKRRAHEAKEADYAPFWDGRSCQDEPAPSMTFADYLAEMSLDGKHGHTDRLIALWYSGTHYDLLLREGEKAGYPVAMTSVQAFGEKTGWRDCGASRDYDNEEDTQAGIETGFENQIEYEGADHIRKFHPDLRDELGPVPLVLNWAVAVAWPGASWHVKFLCTRCKNVSGHSYQMRPRCGKAIRPTRYFDELKPIAKGTRGIAADAARRILDLLGLLGYAWQQEDEETAERGSSAGLGQSGAR